MKNLFIALFILSAAASLCYAADAPKATEPIGAVIETSGVVVGKVTSVIEEGMGGGKGEMVMADESGKTKIFPVDSTVKIVDDAFNVITLNQLKAGSKVEVEYSKEGGAEKAKTIKVTK